MKPSLKMSFELWPSERECFCGTVIKFSEIPDDKEVDKIVEEFLEEIKEDIVRLIEAIQKNRS